jgi:hypothetical protein
VPMTWTDPEVFLEHAGVTVYHVYKDDDASAGARLYWYTVDPEGSDQDADRRTFDVRGLPEADWTRLGDDRDVVVAEIRHLLRTAIEAGTLTADGLRDDDPTVPSGGAFFPLTRDDATRVLTWFAGATAPDDVALAERLTAFAHREDGR